MTLIPRTARTIAACLLLLMLLAGGTVYVLSRILQHALTTDRLVNGVKVRFYGPTVSPFFSVRADSVLLISTTSRLLVAKPVVSVSDWGGLRPSEAAFHVSFDVARVDVEKQPESRDEKIVFPDALRFPVGVVVEGRALTIRMSKGGNWHLTSLRLASQGRESARGSFRLKFPVEDVAPARPGSAGGTPTTPFLNASFSTRWRGATLRYKVMAIRPRFDTLVVIGLRDKRDLREGSDTIHVYSARPAHWWGPLSATLGRNGSSGSSGSSKGSSSPVPGPLGVVSAVVLNGKADWRRDSLNLTGSFRSAALEPLEPAVWNVVARLGPGGGRFTLKAVGARQNLNLAGSWKQPGRAMIPAYPERMRGELSGTVRGGIWTIGRFELPLAFDIPNARLDTGFRVEAQVLSADATRIDLRWNGRDPSRLEIAGAVAPGERWAVAWTRGNIDYESAEVAGVWEGPALTITARIRKPSAYGTTADSLLAENEVTSSGYFLRHALIYRDGETFEGAGQVLWKDAKGHHAVSLNFDALHPVHGRAAIAMQVPGPLEVTADSLYPARFPYDPVRGLAAFDPRVQGRFFWNHQTGEGASLLDIRFTGKGGVLESGLDATWKHDSMRVARIELSTGASRLAGSAVLPFDGRNLKGRHGALWSVPNLMAGSWRFHTSHLNTAEVVALAERSSWPLHGVLNGELRFSPAAGMSGVLRVDSLRLPAGTGLSGITALGITGLGDSLRIEAMVPPRATPRWNDTLFAVVSDLSRATARIRAEARSTSGFAARLAGEIPGWSHVQGVVHASGRLPLEEGSGSLENIKVSGRFQGDFGGDFLDDLEFVAQTFSLSHASARDTLAVSGTPFWLGMAGGQGGTLVIPDLRVVNPRGDALSGRASFEGAGGVARAEVRGSRFEFLMPGGQRARAQEIEADFRWTRDLGLIATTAARNGFVVLPTSPYRVESGFEMMRATVTLPPPHSQSAPSLKAEGRIHDFLFQRKWGWRDATAFFTGFARAGAGRSAGSSKRARPWDLDISLEASGTRNRIDTDILRMTFTGDARMTGLYPYALVNGKISGLQGEVGQTRQAYVLRDFELKWDNVSLEDGALHVEGEKKLRADCRPDTRQTCQIYVRLDGRLEDVGFNYETDCSQSSGDPVSPSVLINSMAQGCYVSETPGGEGNYGSAAFAMLEPALNDRLSRGIVRGSGGFIKSTQVSGLSALIGSDSSGLESVALEVESRSLYRTSVKGRAGYHPETKLANPMEYRLAAEYRPPLERIAQDSLWRARLKNRFTVEAAVETRPEGRDIEDERRVRQRAGLRYRHRFWNLW